MRICKKCDARFNNPGWLCPSCHFKPEFAYGHYRLDPVCGGEGYYAKEDFAHFFELEDSNFWFRSRSQLIFWAIAKYFQKAQKGNNIGFESVGFSNVARIYELMNDRKNALENYKKALEKTADSSKAVFIKYKISSLS